MPLVAAACAHTPQLLVRPPTEDRDLVLRVHAGRPERVALTDRYASPDFEFDRQLLERLKQGRGRERAAFEYF